MSKTPPASPSANTERETKLAALRSALERGEQSGVAEGYSVDRLLKKLGNERGR